MGDWPVKHYLRTSFNNQRRYARQWEEDNIVAAETIAGLDNHWDFGSNAGDDANEQ